MVSYGGMPVTTMTRSRLWPFFEFYLGRPGQFEPDNLFFRELSRVVFVLAGVQIQNMSTAARVAAVSVLVQDRARNVNVGLIYGKLIIALK